MKGMMKKSWVVALGCASRCVENSAQLVSSVLALLPVRVIESDERRMQNAKLPCPEVPG
jgi:hypothetical protein